MRLLRVSGVESMGRKVSMTYEVGSGIAVVGVWFAHGDESIESSKELLTMEEDECNVQKTRPKPGQR
jgi:hypothetical protein